MDCIEAVKFARTLDPTFMNDHRADVKRPLFVLLVVSCSISPYVLMLSLFCRRQRIYSYRVPSELGHEGGSIVSCAG